MTSQTNFFAGFEEKVLETPNEICLVSNEEEISYVELKEISIEIARKIYAKRISMHESDPLPIYVDRSLNALITMFASMYGGIPFTTIDDSTPPFRALEILEQIGISHPILDVTRDRTFLAANTFILDVPGMDYPDSKLEDLSYILLTSGSTGIPKGVMQSKAGIRKRPNYMQNLSNPEMQKGFLSISSFSFGMGISGLDRLAFGTKYFNLDPSAYSFNALIERINELKPYTMSLPSQFCKLLAKAKEGTKFPSVQVLAAGGEEFRYEHFHALKHLFIDSTVFSHALVGSEGGGWLNFQSNLLDEPTEGLIQLTPKSRDLIWFEPKPDIAEEVFEVYVGDVSSIGYFNNPELTTLKYFESDGLRWWKSGDMVKRVAEDKYIYFGRNDDLVKVNGFLVSPLSVSNALGEISGVKDSYVISVKNEKTQLVAFVVTNENATSEQIETELRSKIPNYMYPSRVIYVDSIPWSSRLKVDRKKLESHL